MPANLASEPNDIRAGTGADCSLPPVIHPKAKTLRARLDATACLDGIARKRFPFRPKRRDARLHRRLLRLEWRLLVSGLNLFVPMFSLFLHCFSPFPLT